MTTPDDMPTPPRLSPGAREEIERIADQVAEEEAAETATEVATEVVARGIRPLTTFMVVALCVSLLLHGLTIWRLLELRRTLRSEIVALADGVQASRQQTLRYSLPINQEFPVNLAIPINESIMIPVNTEVRIKQDINLPIDTGIGVVNLPVPLDVSVPISTTVPINFAQTVQISTTVPLDFTVPLEFNLGTGDLGAYLDRLYSALLALREKL